MVTGASRVNRFLDDPEFQKRLCDLIARIHRQAPDVIEYDDLLQEVTLSALDKAHQFRGEDEQQCLSWLRTIARNIQRQRIRTLARQRRDAAAKPASEPVSDETEPNAVLADQERHNEEVARVVLAQASLSRYERSLLAARAAGWSYEVIARLVQTTPDHARQQVHRALRRLRDNL